MCALCVLSVGTPRRTEVVIAGGWCVACHGSTAQQQQSAFTLEYIIPCCRCVRDVPTLKMRVVLFLVCIKNSTIRSKNDNCCRLYSYKWRVFFFWVGILPFFFLCCTYVPRVCRVIPCPILLVRASCHTVFSCDNNSVFITPHSEQHQLFWWDV